MIWKSLVEELLECTISITVDLTSYMVEFNHILVHMFGVCHRQVAELMLCITDGVVRANFHPEFQNELGVTVHPEGTKSKGFRK